jgi:hypothetical protein
MQTRLVPRIRCAFSKLQQRIATLSRRHLFIDQSTAQGKRLPLSMLTLRKRTALPVRPTWGVASQHAL